MLGVPHMLLLITLGPIFAQGPRSSPPPPMPCPCCGCCVGIPILFAVAVALVAALISVPAVIGMWKTFEKAGEPGWAALVPIYNMITAAKITGRPETHGLLCLIPLVGIVFVIMILMDLARSFGKDTLFGVLLVLPIASAICWLMLGLGEARYEGPVYEGEFGYESRPRRRARRRRYRDDDEDDDYEDDR